MKVPALLKNKYVCYALMALAALNIIGYVTVKAWECLALFSLAGYSAHCYCKNVSLAILAALFVANFVFGCGRVKEGFEDALKGPIEHLRNARDSLFRAREGFEVSADNCCSAKDTYKSDLDDQSPKAKCEASADICADFGAKVDDVAKKMTSDTDLQKATGDKGEETTDPASGTGFGNLV